MNLSFLKIKQRENMRSALICSLQAVLSYHRLEIDGSMPRLVFRFWFVLGWVTVLVCQFLLIVLRMRLKTEAPGAALAATV